MTDHLQNQQRYERENMLPTSYKPWQCALMVVGVFAFFNSVIYWVG